MAPTSLVPTTHSANPLDDPRVHVLADEVACRRMVQELAAAIEHRYPTGDIMLVGVRTGALFLTVDLMRALNPSRNVEMTTIHASSYEAGALHTSGHVVLNFDELPVDLSRKHVIIVDDVGDSLLTLLAIKQQFKSQSIAYMSLDFLVGCYKRGAATETVRHAVEPLLNFIGFDNVDPKLYLIGFGMDGDLSGSNRALYRGWRFIGYIDRS